MTVEEMIQKLQPMPPKAVLINDDYQEINGVVMQSEDEVMLSEFET